MLFTLQVIIDMWAKITFDLTFTCDLFHCPLHLSLGNIWKEEHIVWLTSRLCSSEGGLKDEDNTLSKVCVYNYGIWHISPQETIVRM